jgi:hypothetical protein
MTTSSPSEQHLLTLRDWFAGQALTGALAAAQNVTAEHMPLIAKACYQMADAMIAEGAKS